MKSIKQLLIQLIDTPAVSGYENALGMSGLVAKKLSQFLPTEIFPDGSVITRSKSRPNKPTVLISAHIDEVGFFISKKLNQMQYRVLPVGDIDINQVFYSQTNLGQIKAAVKKPKSYNQIFLQTKQKKINLLDPVFWQRQIKIKNSLICAPALDNKVGVTALIILAKKLSRQKFYNLVFAGIAQEETATDSYQTLINQVKPNFIIDIDSAYGNVKPNRQAINIPIIGQGAAFQVAGKNIRLDRMWIAKIVDRLKFKYQWEIPLPYEGETLLSRINDFSGKCLQINIPVARQHQPNSLTNIEDITSLINIVEYLLCQKII